MERQQAKVLNSDETDIIGEIYVNYFTMLDLSGHKKAQKKIDEMFGVLWGQDGLPKNDCIRICVFVDHNRKEYRIYIGNHEKCYQAQKGPLSYKYSRVCGSLSLLSSQIGTRL